MYWRLPAAQFNRGKGTRNKNGLRKIVREKKPIGIIAYVENKPVGWCSIGPRQDFVRLQNSRVLRRVDDSPVWSVVCFFIKKEYRNTGLTVKLLKVSANYAKALGATTLEGYPVEPRKKPMPEVFAFTGIASAFFQAKFDEVARNSDTRPIMRKALL